MEIVFVFVIGAMADLKFFTYIFNCTYSCFYAYKNIKNQLIFLIGMSAYSLVGKLHLILELRFNWADVVEYLIGERDLCRRSIESV